MAAKFGRLILFDYLNFTKHRCRIFSIRPFCVNQVSWNEEKLKKQTFTLELLPEVDKLLEAGKMKHRQHPGVRKIEAITPPEVLKERAYNAISEEGETIVLREAKELCRHLESRRRPAERADIDKKVAEMIPTFDGEDDYELISYVLNAPQLKQLKKRIAMEIGRWKPIEYDRHKCLVYLAGRLVPNYASAYHVFDELKKHDPTFKPKTYFDFGSGVGSSLWAAHSHWSDSITEYFCSDVSPDMNDLCQRLITDEVNEEKHIKPVFFRQFLPASSAGKYDLVVSAFSLLELSNNAERLKAIDILWKKTKEYLVIIEYGTVAGFSCVLDARDFITMVENDSAPVFSAYNSGAHVVSPCPHDVPCPLFMEKSTSCGFHVPYHPMFPRGHSLVVLKDWISYVVIKKGPRPDGFQALPRIVKPLKRKSGHVICRMCCNDGNLKEAIVSKGKQGRNAYRVTRQSERGDVLPVVVKPYIRGTLDEE